MNAGSIAAALSGRKAGRGWSARCPAHDDRNPSLSLRDSAGGGVWVKCFAGCPKNEIIGSLKALGLWVGGTSWRTSTKRLKPSAMKQSADDQTRTYIALSIWKACVPASRTLVEIYVRSRGLVLPATPTLRFHPNLKHPSGEHWPAMVALVCDYDGAPLAIHRTFLARNGVGKASVDPQRMLLGPSRGGAVRLAEPSKIIMVGEGIETCLAAMQATGLPAWAALSTSGLRALDLPKGVRDVIVLADGDDPGEAAARDCALRWKREGRRVRIARPPRGMDFNDLLVGRTSSIFEGAP
jgi:putative DNA primase/helicase